MSREQNEYFEERVGTEDARYHVVPYEDEWAVNVRERMIQFSHQIPKMTR